MRSIRESIEARTWSRLNILIISSALSRPTLDLPDFTVCNNLVLGTTYLCPHWPPSPPPPSSSPPRLTVQQWSGRKRCHHRRRHQTISVEAIRTWSRLGSRSISFFHIWNIIKSCLQSSNWGIRFQAIFGRECLFQIERASSFHSHLIHALPF